MMKFKAFSELTIAILILATVGCKANKPTAEPAKEMNMEAMEPGSYTQPVNSKGKNYPQYVLTISQDGKELGKIVLELFTDIAPKHCANFDSLVAAKFYDGTQFHRVIPGFMIQGGDPNTKFPDKRDMWGVGDSSQTTVPAEFSATPHKRGILSAARKGNSIHSATSQFFLCVDDAGFLDNQYTVYGQVLSGIEVADVVVGNKRDSRDCPLSPISMTVEKVAAK